MNTAIEALRKLLKFHYKHEGYGTLTCTSCGARVSMDYGDNDQPPRIVKKEDCSRNCPWRNAEELVAEHDEHASEP